MKTEELRIKAMESITAADESRYFNAAEANQVAALRAIAWAIIYFADVLRYKVVK